jgi:hypothetical protein
MTHHYLAEDIAQIKRYFPGARVVALRTPFDITPKPRRLAIDTFKAEQEPAEHWQRMLRWTN